MYIGCCRLSTFNTEGGMRNYLMASIGVVGTTCGVERVIKVGSQILNDLIKKSGHNFKNIEIYRNWIPFKV